MRSYEAYRQIVEQELEQALNSVGQMPETLRKAMLYSLKAGGKRLRPVLLLACCEMAGGNISDALPYACAVEMIHTYSLIHDDLPAMDNDDLRRGKPTNHKVFGENIAILAGDGLLNSAAELMAVSAAGREDNLGARAMAVILHHAGAAGMIAGQTEDLEAEGAQPDLNMLQSIHRHKTADLLQAPVEAGLILAGASPETVRLGSEYGLALGMAFQMTDDLLDVTGSAEELGKNTGMDAAMQKMTWVSLRGIEGTRADAAAAVQQAVGAAERMEGLQTAFLKDLAESLLDRKN